MATVLKGEITHDGLTHLHLTNSLQERKVLMVNLSDGFIAMPGDLGLLNIDGYFDFTFVQLERGVKEGFVNKFTFSLN